MISGGENDPFTDAVFWYKPEDNGATPGEGGYTDYFFGNGERGDVTFSRLVLVQWNGGTEPPYTADLPEPGTTFRIVLSPLPTPTPSAPNNGSFTSIFGTELYWSSSLSDFQVQIDTSPDFLTPVVDAIGSGAFGFAFEQPEADQTYYWRVRAVALPGDIYSDWSETWQFTPLVSGVSADAEVAIPDAFQVDGNYPNPFSTVTRIRYALPSPAPVRLEIFDVLGRDVALIVDENQEAGWHDAVFTSDALPAGLYIYRITAGSFTETRTMVLIR